MPVYDNSQKLMISPSKGSVLGMRHLQVLLIFLNIVVMFLTRLNIGVAVVAMTNADKTNPEFPEYKWTEKQKSYIISSFMWGYVLTQFPGGYCCRRFGTKLTMLVSTLGSAMFVLFIPFAVSRGGWQAYCGLRALQGVFQGVMFPAIHAHLANWSPKHERSRLSALAYTGCSCGKVLAMAITGIIAKGPLGWPGISYVFGGLSLVWCVLWFALAADNPPASRLISSIERAYIETSLEHSDDFNAKKIPVPWRAIWSSVPFLALLVVRCAEGFSLVIMLTQIPAYINGVLNLDIKSNGLYSALPFLVMWGLSYVFVIIAEIIMGRQLLSLTAMRKTFNTVAMWLPAMGFIIIGFLEREQMALVITLMALSGGINGGADIGSALTSIDLSPNHAGVLMGVVNCNTSFFQILAPLLVGIIVTDNHNRHQWQVVFFVAALVFFLGNLVYLLWGSALTQPWDAPNLLAIKKAEEKKDICRSEAKPLSAMSFLDYIEEDEIDKDENIADTS